MLRTAASGADGSLLVGAGLFKRFGALKVLEGVNFTLAPNEAVGIVGANGAGKTTLAHVLAGRYPPSAGTVSFGGTDLIAAKRVASPRLRAANNRPHSRIRTTLCSLGYYVRLKRALRSRIWS